MVRINKEEIKGITDDRKKSSCAESDNTARKKRGSDRFCNEGEECHIDWHED